VQVIHHFLNAFDVNGARLLGRTKDAAIGVRNRVGYLEVNRSQPIRNLLE
jgi:hypothetical protein